MPLTKAQKKIIIEELKEKLAKQKAAIFVDFTGLKVKDFASLRKNLKKEGNEIKVAKKTLFGLVLKNIGLEINFKEMKGEIAAIFGYKDEMSPAKMAYQFGFANTNLKILGGIFEKNFIGAEKIIELAQLPTKKELLARLTGTVASPISNFVSVLQGNIKNLVRVLGAIKGR